jgi:hypothetical protein
VALRRIVGKSGRFGNGDGPLLPDHSTADRYLSVLDDPNEKARRAYRIVKRLLDPEVV